jgi:hypothetical protein
VFPQTTHGAAIHIVLLYYEAMTEVNQGPIFLALTTKVPTSQIYARISSQGEYADLNVQKRILAATSDSSS